MFMILNSLKVTGNCVTATQALGMVFTEAVDVAWKSVY